MKASPVQRAFPAPSTGQPQAPDSEAPPLALPLDQAARRPGLWDRLLFGYLDRLVGAGTLMVITFHGAVGRFGSGGHPQVVLRLDAPHTSRRLLLRPGMAAGECYMDGSLRLERGSLQDFLFLVTAKENGYDWPSLQRLRDWIRPLLRGLQQLNGLRRSRRNVAHHYDLSGRLYELFLDSDRQYSCAYYATGTESLEQAQQAKKRHIEAKLLLRDGQRVLDIGCGWGGLGLHLARQAQVDVTGITLSAEQLAVARERARRSGLSACLRFELRDYREQEGEFDRIVSVGMFEHVGAPQFDTFFRKLRALLRPDGVALLHAIGRNAPPGGTNSWLRKYIFPGGYCPALSEVLAAVERSGLWVTDVEILRLHYADTLREWNRRFLLQREKARSLYDERFCRMWEFYLAACETAFRTGENMVFQIQLARRRDAVPRTRDYLYAKVG